MLDHSLWHEKGVVRKSQVLLALTSQQPVHLPHLLPLGDYDILQYGLQLGTDAVPQGIFRHVDGALMVGNHLPHKIGADIVVGAGIVHLCKHILGDLLEPMLIQAQILAGALRLIAAL